MRFFPKKLTLFSGDPELKCLGDGKGRKHPELPTRLKSKLKKYFQPENEKFFELAKMRFDWMMD